jgi:hypothetical protein
MWSPIRVFMTQAPEPKRRHASVTTLPLPLSGFSGSDVRWAGECAGRCLRALLWVLVFPLLEVVPARSGEILLRCHESRSTLMTSNRPVENWGKLLGDVPTAGAILDRLPPRAKIIEMPGHRHRLARRGTDGKVVAMPSGWSGV